MEGGHPDGPIAEAGGELAEPLERLRVLVHIMALDSEAGAFELEPLEEELRGLTAGTTRAFKDLDVRSSRGSAVCVGTGQRRQ